MGMNGQQVLFMKGSVHDPEIVGSNLGQVNLSTHSRTNQKEKDFKRLPCCVNDANQWRIQQYAHDAVCTN